MNIKTYNTLLNYLKETSLTLQELKKVNNYCYEPLEDLFNLFSYLKLIKQFNNFEISSENFNNGIFNNNSKLLNFLDKNCKNNGSFSDLTLFNDKYIIASSCKNWKSWKNKSINDLDIDKIENVYRKSNDKRKLILCIVISNKKELQKKIKNCNISSTNNKNKLLDNSTLIFDWNDIYSFYLDFKKIDFNKFKLIEKPILKLKPHQQKCIIEFNEVNNKNFVIGFKCRSGKTYTIAGIIYQQGINKNYLIITSAPTETLG